MERGVFLLQVHFHDLLGIVPTPTSIGHKDRLEKTEEGEGDQVADKEVRIEEGQGQGHKENDDDIPDNQSIKFYSKHNNAEEQEQIKSSFLYEIFGDSLLCNERAWRAILPYELDWESVMNQSYY